MPGGWELLVIVGVLLLLFGAKKLPEMARSIGQSARVFKGEMKGLREDEKTADDAPSATDPAKPAAAPAPLPPPAASSAKAEPAAEPQTRSGQ